MTIWDPISIRKVGRQHMYNQNQHTDGQRSKRERDRTNGKQWSSLETKVCATGTPLKLELDTKAQDGK
jgi:hypothetical protein